MPPPILTTPAFSDSSVGRLRLRADGLSVLGVVRVLGRCFRRVAQRWLIACGYLLLPVVDLLRADGLWLRLVLPLQSPDFSRVRGSPFAIRPFISVQIRADWRYRLGTTIGCDGGAEISLCVAHVAYRPFLPHLRPGLYLPFAECLISR